jgi:hypothetical protein
LCTRAFAVALPDLRARSTIVLAQQVVVVATVFGDATANSTRDRAERSLAGVAASNDGRIASCPWGLHGTDSAHHSHRLSMRSLLLALATPLAHLTPSGLRHAAAAKPALTEPGISPDGREIAFVAGGDIWTVPAAGGEARLLVAHPAAESRPLYSPDGSRLAFVSTRTGNGDVYILTLASGDLRRLTFDDQSETLGGWSPDGAWIYFPPPNARSPA